jgi:hypothetical protein
VLTTLLVQGTRTLSAAAPKADDGSGMFALAK